MDMVITEAIYTCINNVYSDNNNKLKYFSEGKEYLFVVDENINEFWLSTMNDLGDRHVVAMMDYELNEDEDIIGGDWDFEFIDEYFELKQVICWGES